MKMKASILASAIALSCVSFSAAAADNNIKIGANGLDDHWATSVELNLQSDDSLGINMIKKGGDDVSTFDYRHTFHAGGFEMSAGASLMSSQFTDDNSDSGNALGVNMGFGWNFQTGTSMKLSVTKPVIEEDFSQGKIVDAYMTQTVTKNLSLKAGYRKVTREIDRQKDTFVDSGYAGITYSF